MNIRELRRTAKISLEEGDNITFRETSLPSEFSDANLHIEIYVKIDDVVYETAFKTFSDDYIRSHIRDQILDVKEVLDSDDCDLSGLNWKKYSPKDRDL